MDPHPAIRVCGVRIDAIETSRAADEIVARAGRPAAIHHCNAFTLSIASRDPMFAAALDRGDLNLPDGMPLVWIARRLGVELPDRSYGPDVMATVLDRGRDRGLRHFLHGSTPEVLAALTDQISSRWPGTQIAGTESPPFRSLSEDEEDQLVQRVRETQTDIMWVGLGTPKQDWFVDRVRTRIDAPLVAVGAAFDFLSGHKRQAPRRVQRLGLEWAWRLGNEPRRLGRRYLQGNVNFLLGAVRSQRLDDRPGTE